MKSERQGHARQIVAWIPGTAPGLTSTRPRIYWPKRALALGLPLFSLRYFRKVAFYLRQSSRHPCPIKALGYRDTDKAISICCQQLRSIQTRQKLEKVHGQLFLEITGLRSSLQDLQEYGNNPPVTQRAFCGIQSSNKKSISTKCLAACLRSTTLTISPSLLLPLPIGVNMQHQQMPKPARIFPIYSYQCT